MKFFTYILATLGIVSAPLFGAGTILFPIGGGTGTSTAPILNSILIGNSSGVYDVKTLTQGTNVTISNSGGTVTISATGGVSNALGTSSPWIAGQVAYVKDNATVTSVATSSIASGTGITVTNGSSAYVLGSQPTITNTGVLSLKQTFGSALTGALTIATSTQSFNGLTFANNITDNGSNTFTFTPNVSGVLSETGGGTNQSSYAKGDTLYASAANTLSKLSIGTGGQILSVVAGIPGWVATTTFGAPLSYSSGNVTCPTCFTGTPANPNSKWATTTDALGITPNGGNLIVVGIGTSTPKFPLTVASSTRSQLDLSDGSLGSDHWDIRTINNNFYLATSSAATSATSTVAALSFDTNGVLTLGKPLTVPNGGTGATTLTGLVSGNGTGAFTATANGTGGQILGMSGGVPTWLATTTFNSPLTYSAGAVSCASCLTTAVTSIGPIGALQTGPAVTLATSSTAFNGLTSSTTITASGNQITFANTLAGLLGIAGGGTNASTFGTTNGNVAFDGTRLVNYAGYTQTASLFTAPNASTTNLTVGTYLQSPIIVGGTAVGSSLEERATIGVGVGAEFIKWTLGSNGAIEAARATESGFGIGTTTPRWALTVASSTRPQIALTDGSLTSDIWTMRGINGNFYLATSSPSTFATSTVAAITVNQSAATLFGVATTSPWRTLSVVGTVALNGLTSSTAGNAVCILASFDVVNAGNTQCTTSSLKTKHDIESLGSVEAENDLMRLRPVAFTYNESGERRLGFVAEEVAKVDTRLVEYATRDVTFPKASGEIKKGDPLSTQNSNMIAVVIKYLQDNPIGKAKRSVEENWQWIAIALLALCVLYQQYQLWTLKKSY